MTITQAVLALLSLLGLGSAITLSLGLKNALKRERDARQLRPYPPVSPAAVREAERTMTEAHQAANEALAKLPLDPSDAEAAALLADAERRLKAAKERVR